jgi:hypothetical protein
MNLIQIRSHRMIFWLKGFQDFKSKKTIAFMEIAKSKMTFAYLQIVEEAEVYYLVFQKN